MSELVRKTFVSMESTALGEMPLVGMDEKSLSPFVAYDRIREFLKKDWEPSMNLATFSTSTPDPLGEALVAEFFSADMSDEVQRAKVLHIQTACIKMIARLFNLQTSAPVGIACVGSSEAVMLAVLAMKRKWQQTRQSLGRPHKKPNLVMGSAVHVCWHKTVFHLDLEAKIVPCRENKFVLDPQEAVSLVDENTIGICVIMGTTYTGEYEDVRRINDLLLEREMDIPLHIDAASGGFVVPFLTPELEWDFRLQKVVSINVSGHKYGQVYPSIGWNIWRSEEFTLPELIGHNFAEKRENASESVSEMITLSPMIMQYYRLLHLGFEGYRSIMKEIVDKAADLTSFLRRLGLTVVSRDGGKGLPIVAFHLAHDPNRRFDEYTLADRLRDRGWQVPAYPMARHLQHLTVLRVVLRSDFTQGSLLKLKIDIEETLWQLNKLLPRKDSAIALQSDG